MTKYIIRTIIIYNIIAAFNNFIDLGDTPSLDDCRREWGTKWDLYYLNKESLEQQLKNIDKIIEKEDEINANRD